MKPISCRTLTTLFFLAFVLVLPLAASAATIAPGNDPWDSGLYQLYQILSGTTVRIIGFIMIIAAGIMIAVSEGQAVRRLFWVIGGVGLALNVPAAFNMLFPSSGGYEIHLQALHNSALHVQAILSQL